MTAYGDQRVVTEAVDFENPSVAAMRHENGIPSRVTTSCAASQGNIGLMIIAENATLEIDLVANTLTGTVDGESVHVENDRSPFYTEIEDFLDAVESNDATQPRSPYADATKSFELTLAVDESLHTGDTVEVR